MSRSRSALRSLTAAGLAAAALTAAAQSSTAAPSSAERQLSASTTVSSTGEREAVQLTATTRQQSPFRGTGRLADARGVNLGEASSLSAKALGPESIIGGDGRWRVTPTTGYPARATVRILSSHGQCTGWMIDDDTVATAGHCVHNGTSWATNVSVTPGQDGASTPYGSCGSRGIHSVLGWTRDRNWEYDYAAIKLNCTIGRTVGWYGLRWTTASLNGVTSYNRGYSGDKPAEQWMSIGSVTASDARKVYYTNDTVGGNSGGPTYDYVNGAGPYGIAVHAYGTTDGVSNSGTRITQDVYNNYVNWMGL